VATRRVVILGAAGRDFHNFNVVYRDDPAAVVVAFAAAQIPGLGGRRYPPSLAGARYPDGIPIEDEAGLEAICRRGRADSVVFAYSDVTQPRVMELATTALACGPDFVLLGPGRTMLKATAPVVAVSAVRTGCGKSPIARWLAARLRKERAPCRRHPPSHAVQ
jgi:predicted GTPase